MQITRQEKVSLSCKDLARLSCKNFAKKSCQNLTTFSDRDSESAKRLEVFQGIDAKADDGVHRCHTLKGMSDTRWNLLAEALSTLEVKFQSSIEAIQALANDGDTTVKSLCSYNL